MPPQSSRRRTLQRLAVCCSLSLGGCLAGDRTTSTTSATEESTTFGPTSGPDERETRTPPGSPPLDSHGEWPQFRFDAANTGSNLNGTGLREAEPYWRLAPFGGASLSRGTLFSGGRNEPSLVERDPATAAIRSQTRLEHGPRGQPTVAGDRAFVTSFSQVTCIETDRDAVAWQESGMDGMKGEPTVHDGVVYVNTDGFQSTSPHVRAFDVVSGKQLWRYDTGSRSWSTPAVADGTVFVNSEDGLHAIDAETGEQAYHVSETGNLWATPAVADGAVFVMARHDDAVDLIAVNATDGTIRWRTSEVARTDEPPVVGDDCVYVGTDTEIVALDIANGKSTRQSGGPELPLARVGDVLYAAARGRLTAYDVDRDERLWSYATEEVQVSDTIQQAVHSIVPVDGAVYVSASDAFHGLGPVRS